jgi:hypothetical protein
MGLQLVLLVKSTSALTPANVCLRVKIHKQDGSTSTSEPGVSQEVVSQEMYVWCAAQQCMSTAGCGACEVIRTEGNRWCWCMTMSRGE